MPSNYLLRYPIGPVPEPGTTPPETASGCLAALAGLPQKLTALVQDWPDTYLDTPYRPEGWTVRQVVHHLADSHMNAYVRTRLALTETEPPISPYDEAAWATLPDYTLPVAPSLALLAALHLRWVTCLQTPGPEQLARTYRHPANNQLYTLLDVLGLYAWHSEHHYQQIAQLAQRNGWGAH